MRLYDTVFILYQIHVRIDFMQDSSSSSCRRKGDAIRKFIGFILIRYGPNWVSQTLNYQFFVKLVSEICSYFNVCAIAKNSELSLM